MNFKIRWLRNKLSFLDLQGMIVSNPISIKYLIGVEGEGILLITRKENIYITDGRYIEQVHKILTIDDEIIVYDVKDLTKDDYETFFTFCESVGFEEEHLTYAQYKEYIHKYQINSFEETDGLIEKQRMIKDEEEIENIKKACQLTDECFDHLKSYIKEGQTEIEIAEEIKRFFMEKGADGLAFDTIVASGENSSMPHAVPTKRQIVHGDVITIDMGCKYKGYCSDMTRTIFVKEVPQDIKFIYDLVLKNQLRVSNEIMEGANVKVLSKSVESDFRLNNFELIHSLGHGVGLEIHELPSLNTKYDLKLKENMVITNEPGIYIPGKYGVRIEDTILVTKTGNTKLTKSNRGYVVVG